MHNENQVVYITTKDKAVMHEITTGYQEKKEEKKTTFLYIGFIFTNDEKTLQKNMNINKKQTEMGYAGNLKKEDVAVVCYLLF